MIDLTDDMVVAAMAKIPGCDHDAMVDALEAALAVGRAENEDAILRDAARYRWLRSRDLDTIYSGGVFVGKTPDKLVLNLEHCDAAVDAGRAAEAGK